jgi:hypothetical protein
MTSARPHESSGSGPEPALSTPNRVARLSSSSTHRLPQTSPEIVKGQPPTEGQRGGPGCCRVGGPQRGARCSARERGVIHVPSKTNSGRPPFCVCSTGKLPSASGRCYLSGHPGHRISGLIISSEGGGDLGGRPSGCIGPRCVAREISGDQARSSAAPACQGTCTLVPWGPLTRRRSAERTVRCSGQGRCKSRYKLSDQRQH